MFLPMISLKTLLNSTDSSKFIRLSSISRRPFSRPAQSAPVAGEKIEPLGGFFRRVISGEERAESNRAAAENAGTEEMSLGDKLRNLEEEIRDLNQKRCETVKSKPVSKLKSASESKPVSESRPAAVDSTAFGMEDPMIHRELSPDMKVFAEHLYAKGYLKNATFLRRNKFDPTSFEIGYAREFLKFAASNFGEDHPEVARWLSAGDLKKIALFGCPTIGHKTVFAAKHMRSFFRIDEHKVCQACTLKERCRHPNKTIKKEYTKLHLGSVMKVLIMYAMESVPRSLVVPQEIKDSVSRLLKEIVSLSRETP